MSRDEGGAEWARTEGARAERLPEEGHPGEARGKGRAPSLTRRRFLAGVGVVAAAAGLEGIVLEPRRLAVSRHRVGGTDDAGAASLRLTLLTDLHLRELGGLEEAVAQEVAAYAPHGVLIVGDAVDRTDTLPLLRDFLSMLPPESPVYATLGNWEYWSGVDLGALAAVYADASATLLVNESVEIGDGGRRATLVGLDDLVGGTPDLARALPAAPGSGTVLLLCHCPAFRDTIPEAAATGVAAMLSGHTHGGQVALAGWAPMRPRGSGRYVAGWYGGAGPRLYVSRGIGTSAVPVRLGSVPEVAHFEWHPAGESGGGP